MDRHIKEYKRCRNEIGQKAISMEGYECCQQGEEKLPGIFAIFIFTGFQVGVRKKED